MRLYWRVSLAGDLCIWTEKMRVGEYEIISRKDFEFLKNLGAKIGIIFEHAGSMRMKPL